MLTYQKKHRNKNYQKSPTKQKFLMNIDYLIINLEGLSFGHFPDNSEFHLKDFDYGTKIFTRRSELYYKNEKIGTFTTGSRSSIISENLSQLQLENHLFYTKTLSQIKQIIYEFTQETNLSFNAINRLDIAIDKSDINNNYRDLLCNINNGTFLVSGRPKNLQSYFETYRGKSVLNGFQFGKRSSDKILRVYNKSLSLQLTEKPYINDFYKNNGLDNNNVWRFEYQLNSAFFRDLFLLKKDKIKLEPQQKKTLDLNDIDVVYEEYKYKMTWEIFDYSTLLELFQTANKGFFDVRLNTGLSQVNKEKQIKIFDFEYLKQQFKCFTPVIKKIKRTILSTTTIKKRLAKSLFREYYTNNQDISYIVSLNLLLDSIDLTNERKLFHWFNSKLNFYLHEFRSKEKLLYKFDFDLYNEHKLIYL